MQEILSNWRTQKIINSRKFSIHKEITDFIVKMILSIKINPALKQLNFPFKFTLLMILMDHVIFMTMIFMAMSHGSSRKIMNVKILGIWPKYNMLPPKIIEDYLTTKKLERRRELSRCIVVAYLHRVGMSLQDVLNSFHPLMYQLHGL